MIGIKWIRKSRKLSAQMVAEAVGIPLRTYVRLENPDKSFVNGAEGIALGYLQKLASFYDCSIDELISENPLFPPATEADTGEGTEAAPAA